MVDNLADCREFGAVVEPVDGVHLPYGLKRNLMNWQILAQVDKAVDIPSIKTKLTWPEVILLSHEASLTGEQP